MTVKTDNKLSVDEKKEIELLRARLAELEGAEKKESTKIQLDEYIPVMSLIPFRLNLSTKEMGTGDIKKFTKFGEVKNILYKDLVDIMEVHSNFLKAGYFYILDPRVIRQQGLDETYSEILTKEKIEEILSANKNPEHCVNLYNSANEEQKKIIIQLFINKIKENPDSVNLNTVEKISKISKTDILKKAEESKALEQSRAEENKQ